MDSVEEYRIEIPENGHLYAKKWLPEKCLFPIPLVLLHDSLGCVALWRDFPEILADRLSCPVIAYDRHGFGRSSARQKSPSLNFIEEEATHYFPLLKSAFCLSDYLLLGHSVGGAMAIAIAAQDKECRAVVTLASQAFVEDRTRKGIEAAMEAFKKPGQPERLAKWHGSKAAWVFRAWTDVWLSEEFRSWSLAPYIGKVFCPVLAIHGDQDEYGSRAFPEFIAKKSGGISKMRILPACGHMPHREKTWEVLDAVASFVSGHRSEVPEKEQLIPRKGNFKKLITYRKAEAIYDITYYFCTNFLRRGDRTIDQMVQAARSGKQNIAEGSAASATSGEMEIKLINVAKASLQELLMDYEDFLRTRGHRQWEDDSVELAAMRKLGRSHNDSAFFMQMVKTRPPETIANMAIVLIKQNDYLLFRQLKALEEAFLKEGGMRERMTRMRLQARRNGGGRSKTGDAHLK
ncbi:four helix bundle suffix domain-containing protein [Desulfobotulus sp.]|jgi:four helix bundle suffix protein|uniref:four helix bundle suffix domain-containing protein n=1 Tax=Desulfobotulus sp. TaxID=1940337 RepID=UPI002A36F57F|nr:four helix bundle suffix domain-containing protein [Desulfobotulus sp.]MDY0164561.1 four helix bundle suffix domain-containing protein [Desulfobotulus sp.]